MNRRNFILSGLATLALPFIKYIKPLPRPILVEGSIQEAIKQAKDGDTVVVLPGEYHESIFLKDSVAIYVKAGAMDLNNTIITPEALANAIERFERPCDFKVTIWYDCDNTCWS